MSSDDGGYEIEQSPWAALEEDDDLGGLTERVQRLLRQRSEVVRELTAGNFEVAAGMASRAAADGAELLDDFVAAFGDESAVQAPLLAQVVSLHADAVTASLAVGDTDDATRHWSEIERLLPGGVAITSAFAGLAVCPCGNLTWTGEHMYPPCMP